LTTPQQFVVRDQRQPGWFFVDNELIDKFGKQLGAYGVAVYAVLARYSKNSTQQVNLSQRDIAAMLGISQGRVRASLRELVDAGLIHMEVPARPSPGVISEIMMLKLKTTEHHMLSSTAELSATRARNKEERPRLKTNTETETETPPPLLLKGFDFELPRAREANETPNHRYSQKDFSDSRREDLAKELCERIAFAATRSNVELIIAVLKVIQTKHGFATYAACCEFLEGCVKNARAHHDLNLELKPRFFFEDGDYEDWRPVPEETPCLDCSPEGKQWGAA
jgi:hypothetical protein